MVTFAIAVRLGDQQRRSRSPENGDREETQHSDEVASAHPIAADGKPQPAKKNWWYKPNNWIRLATFLFVGAYTFLTYCTLQETHTDNVAGQRGYIFPSGVTWDTAGTNPFLIAVNFKNGGVTPIYKVAGVIRVFILPATLDRPIQEYNNLGEPETAQNKAFLYKDIVIGLPGKQTFPANYLDLIATNQKSRVYAWGEIEFFDVFNERRTFYFCYRFTRERIADNEYEYCDKHNGEDPN